MVQTSGPDPSEIQLGSFRLSGNEGRRRVGSTRYLSRGKPGFGFQQGWYREPTSSLAKGGEVYFVEKHPFLTKESEVSEVGTETTVEPGTGATAGRAVGCYPPGNIGNHSRGGSGEKSAQIPADGKTA